MIDSVIKERKEMKKSCQDGYQNNTEKHRGLR